MRKRIIFTFLISLLTCDFFFAQNFVVDNEKDFNKALQLYNSGKFNEAKNLFEQISKRIENNSKQTASSFFIVKILNDQKKYSEAKKFGELFLIDFPESKYSSEVKTLILNSLIKTDDFKSAFNKAIKFIEESKSIVFNKETKSITEKIALNHLANSDIEEVIDDYNTSELKSFLLLLDGKVYLREGEIAEASKRFTEITTKHITSDEYVEALNLKKQYNSYNNESSIPVVGVVLSLTDQNDREIESANEILEGIKFAFHEYNKNNTDKFGISIFDIQRDKSKTNEIVKSLIDNNDIRCIIGPIFSDDVRNTLTLLNESSICLISPTATDEDLIELSDNFYQANPSLAERAKIFAQYLYFVENKRTLAILNAIDGYSPLLAASFTKEFENLGGKIIAKETYKSKSFTLSDQLNRIASLSNSLQGIYAPISDPTDAKAILSQLVKTGLDVNIYGNQDWFLGKDFESSSAIADKLTFESDYFIDFNDREFKELSKNFKQTTGKEINRNVLYGYDSAKYILTVLRNIDPTRKNIKYKIESGINVSGYHNNISFDYERINKYINIVRYSDEVFELVDKFRSGR